MPNAVLVELGAALLPSHSVANADKTTVGAEQANHQPARDCGRLWPSWATRAKRGSGGCCRVEVKSGRWLGFSSMSRLQWHRHHFSV
eukprot:scaffold8461_cov68-Phaeocystis_antarctica.AAC.8